MNDGVKCLKPVSEINSFSLVWFHWKIKYLIGKLNTFYGNYLIILLNI